MSSSQTTETETAPATRTDVQWVGFTASTTAFAAWFTNRVIFHGQMPIEATGVIQYGVPLAMSGIAAEWRWRMAKRRGQCTPAPPAE